MSLTVQFTDTSSAGPSGPITAWSWDFGDSGTSTSESPSHTYASAGTYTVTLTITGTGSDGTASTQLTVNVSSPTGPTASFTSSPTGLTVSFTDTSTAGTSGPLTAHSWNFGDGATSTSTSPSHTYAATGSYTVTLTVTGTSPDGTSSVSHTVNVAGGVDPTPAGFPSVLSTSGRNLVDANGHTMPRLKGFNVQPAGWSASNYTDMYAKGARIIRTLVFWDKIEPTAGSISSSYVTGNLDPHISRAAAAGLYNVLCLYYGPNGVHCPSWVGGSALGNYATHGQNITQYLANRYGHSGNPQYTASVIGMGINEPTPDSASNSYLSTHLSHQAQMMTWMRVYAPDWIGFISAAYGPSAWIPNASGSGQSSQTFTAAANDPFSGAGNWLVEAHCYFETTTDGETRTWDGRNQYGMPNGSAIIKADNSSYPPSGHTRAKCQASLDAFWAPYVAYCGSGHANVPLAVGEWGWKPANSGGDNYASDMAAAMATAGAAIEIQWDYNTSTSSDPWAARPGGSWQSATTTWMNAA